MRIVFVEDKCPFVGICYKDSSKNHSEIGLKENSCVLDNADHVEPKNKKSLRNSKPAIEIT